MLPGLRASTAWDGVAGSELGSGKAKQWCIPWGYELNNITYNRNIFDKVGVKPPKNLDEMLEVAAKVTKDAGGPYGGAARALATIHPDLVGLFGFGQRTSDGGRQAEGRDEHRVEGFTEKWVKMIQARVRTVDPHLVPRSDLAGARMIFDDILGYFMNGGDNKEKGHLGYAPFAANPAAKAPTPNVWIWSLALSSFSKQKDAAWLFMQWAASTEHGLFGARKMDFVNPVRASVWKDSEFRDRIAKSYPGYLEQHDVSSPGAKIYFTAQPLFFDLTTEWAASLQKMVAKEVSVDEGLDKLAESINRQLKQAGLG